MNKTEKYKITSLSPLIMHAGTLSNPTNPWSKAIKAISGKRDKVDADFEEMARLEWYGGLYTEAGMPVIPADAIEACLINASKKRKKGPQARAGLYVEVNAPLQYEGPKNIDKLWADERFRYQVGVIVARSRIMRTRAIFREWSAEIEVSYNAELLNLSEINDFVEIGGDIIGLLDRRPKFGRFEVI